jgi:hypothetical protein
MRMGMRRFTRLTKSVSKKIENHIAMVAIHAVYYNFARIHGADYASNGGGTVRSCLES